MRKIAAILVVAALLACALTLASDAALIVVCFGIALAAAVLVACVAPPLPLSLTPLRRSSPDRAPPRDRA